MVLGTHWSMRRYGRPNYADQNTQTKMSQIDEYNEVPDDVGPKSERRCIPIKDDEYQQMQIGSAIMYDRDPLAMALLTIAMKTPEVPPPWAYEGWQGDLYGALTQTQWTDCRTLEICSAFSFRTASGFAGFLDSITGGGPGETYMSGPYLTASAGTFDDPNNKMASYLRGLGFDTIAYTQGDAVDFVQKRDAYVPTPFCALPMVLQDAIHIYAGGTEGLARLAYKLAPPVTWRTPSSLHPEEQGAYNKMKKRDREGPLWEEEDKKQKCYPIATRAAAPKKCIAA